MNEKVKQLSEKLNAGLIELMNSDRYAEYLKMQSRFHHYSFNNAILILMQCPTATKVAGLGVWNKLNRRVKKGEHGIMIFAPSTKKFETEDGEEITKLTGFRAAYVFDYEQTEGDELDNLAVKLQKSVDNYTDLISAIKHISECPITFTELSGGANGRYTRGDEIIEIQEGMSEAQTIKTMLHEVAHSILHKETDKNRETKECEAESVAFIVSDYFGIDTSEYSFGYIAGWSDMETFKKALADIQKCADKLINDIEKILLTK